MKAAILGLEGFEIRDIPRPVVKDTGLLVKTIACGICEGDVFSYRNATENGILPENPDRPLGHEGTGVVVETGPRAGGFAPGDLVTSIDGAYAEYFATSPDRVVKVPSGVEPTRVVGEPLACCVHGAGRYGTKNGDSAAVIGCGFMGILCVELLRVQGAGSICVLDLLEWRLRDARRHGATASYVSAGRTPVEVGRDLGVFAVVVEATGTPGGLAIAEQLVAEHGRLVIVGYHQSQAGTRSVNMKLWNWKAIDVVSAHVRREDEKVEAMARGLGLLEAGQLHYPSLVTEYPFDDIRPAFADLLGRREGLYKASLVFP